MSKEKTTWDIHKVQLFWVRLFAELLFLSFQNLNSKWSFQIWIFNHIMVHKQRIKAKTSFQCRVLILFQPAFPPPPTCNIIPPASAIHPTPQPYIPNLYHISHTLAIDSVKKTKKNKNNVYNSSWITHLSANQASLKK